MKIRPETRRSMMRAWGLSFMIFAITVGSALWREHQIGELICTLAVFPTLFAAFPLLGELAATRNIRHAEDRKAWRAAYKASPASHYLNLRGD